MLGPIKELGKSADGVGVINSVPEIDGVVRRLPLLMRVGKEVYPSVALEVIRVAVRDPSYQVKANEGGIVAMRVPGFKTIKTDQNGRIWLRWNKEFQTVSASQEDFNDLNGKVVIIGTTAEGIGGVVASPTGEQYSHQAIATSLQTVLDGENIQRPYLAKLAEIGVSAFLGLLLIVLVRFTYYTVVGLSIVGLVYGIVYSVQYLWAEYLYLMDATMPIVVIILVGMHALFNRFILEFKLKQQIKKQFEHYLAPAMVQKLQKNPDLLKLGGETRNMTFLFCDIRGFTPISEKYKGNPEGLTKLINRFLTKMTDVIISHGGTIDKFMGDCIMAFWNAPLDVDNHAELAVQSAKVMMDELKMLNMQLKVEELPEIKIGIGINTGEALVGNMGSDQRFDYSVIGDDVNLASRLESSSKTLGHTLVIGQKTVDAIGQGEFLYIDKINVKGKTEEIKVYTTVAKRKKKNV